jgi:hypothetical protein
MNTEKILESINFHATQIAAYGTTQPRTLQRDQKEFHREQYNKNIMRLDDLRAEEARASLEACSVKEVAVANALNEAAEEQNELEYAQAVEKSTAALRERLKVQKEIDEYNSAGIASARELIGSTMSPYR